jgi:hypothetical protein
MKNGTTLECFTTLRLCKTCKRETPHEIHTGEGCKAYICIPCKQRGELYEQTRD